MKLAKYLLLLFDIVDKYKVRVSEYKSIGKRGIEIVKILANSKSWNLT